MWTRKQRISSGEVAARLVGWVFTGVDEAAEKLRPFTTLPTDRVKWELLFLRFFWIRTGIMTSLRNYQKLVDALHSSIQSSTGVSHEELAALETALIGRLFSYTYTLNRSSAAVPAYVLVALDFGRFAAVDNGPWPNEPLCRLAGIAEHAELLAQTSELLRRVRAT